MSLKLWPVWLVLLVGGSLIVWSGYEDVKDSGHDVVKTAVSSGEIFPDFK